MLEYEFNNYKRQSSYNFYLPNCKLQLKNQLNYPKFILWINGLYSIAYSL